MRENRPQTMAELGITNEFGSENYKAACAKENGELRKLIASFSMPEQGQLLNIIEPESTRRDMAVSGILENSRLDVSGEFVLHSQGVKQAEQNPNILTMRANKVFTGYWYLKK